MKISVVTVCWNSARTISHTLESFLSQTHSDKELVIIDGASSDNTLAIVEAYRSDAIRIFSERDRGIYDAMNKGLRLYSGDAVGFLNSDDAFHSSASLGLINEGLHAADVVFGDLNMVGNHTEKRTKRLWRPGRYFPRAFHLGWAPPHPTLYVRRRVAEAVGEFDTRYTISADYDFAIRALTLHRFRSAYIAQTLVDFQLGGMSSRNWSAAIRGNLECWEVRRRQLGTPFIDIALFARPLRRFAQLLRS